MFPSESQIRISLTSSSFELLGTCEPLNPFGTEHFSNLVSGNLWGHLALGSFVTFWQCNPLEPFRAGNLLNIFSGNLWNLWQLNVTGIWLWFDLDLTWIDFELAFDRFWEISSIKGGWFSCRLFVISGSNQEFLRYFESALNSKGLYYVDSLWFQNWSQFFKKRRVEGSWQLFLMALLENQNWIGFFLGKTLSFI